MLNASVIFRLDGANLTVQCSRTEKMRDICQRFAVKAEKNFNSLLFLYGGNQLNLDLTFEAQATSMDKTKNEMKVLVHTNESDNFVFPKGGENINLNSEKIDEIITSFNNIKDTINDAKLFIENIIKNSSMNSVNFQLKNVNAILNTVNEDIKKNISKIKYLLDDSISEIKRNKNKYKPKIND